MRFEQMYSSSSGNLYTVTASNGKRLLLECGVPWKKMQKALSYNLPGIVGCLVTHEHKDHCKAIHEVMAAGIDCYMSPGTFRALKLAGQRRAHQFMYRDQVYILGGGFSFRAFEAHHDAEDPVYYVIRHRDDNEVMLFAPDTAFITQRFEIPFSIIAIECSYQADILQARVDAGTINESLAKRLLTSHMEKAVTMKYLAECCNLSQCRELHLLHMSGDNIDKEQTRKEFEDRFMIPTIITGVATECPSTQG